MIDMILQEAEKLTARECSVSWRTAHFMRMRLCELMEAATPAFRSGPGVAAQVDGTCPDESLSGLADMPREAHQTGHDVRVRGTSSLKVRVVCATNDLGDRYLALCDRGRPTDDALRGSLVGAVCGGTSVSTLST